MDYIEQSFRFKVYSSVDELSLQDKEMMFMAIQHLEYAYAPYSKFHVGAAVRLENGVLCPGSNQENASYPLCMCGERVALYNAAANHPNVAPQAIAITIRNQKMPIQKPVSPCGACRQVISEYENIYQSPIRILLKSDVPEVIEISSVKDILPLGFDGSFL
jgi:cytidine deaminase